MIAIMAIEAADQGVVVLNEEPDTQARYATSRINVTATLDGGAAFDHRGFSDTDRVVTIKAVVDQDTEDDLWSMMESGQALYLSCHDGFFEGGIKSLSCKNGSVTLSWKVKEKLA